VLYNFIVAGLASVEDEGQRDEYQVFVHGESSFLPMLIWYRVNGGIKQPLPLRQPNGCVILPA
jgi:hypothetical protein